MGNLPAGIFESFQKDPGTDMEPEKSVLDSMDQNSPLARMLGKSSQLISKQRLPEQNMYAPKSDYEVNVQPQSDSFSDGEREIPSTQDLIASRLAKLNESKPVQQVAQKPVPQYEPIQKQTQQTQQPVYNTPQVSPVIDYSLINTMLKSIVEEQFKGLKSQMLTENKKSGISEAAYVTIGNTIRFIDKKNNIYEGKLKLVGNINDQSI